MEKKFFWRDKSGRGFSGEYNKFELLESFKGEKSYDGETIRQWEKNAEEGDRWENAANEITRIQ